ncbi:MAG TPA: hypothetical protein ENG59_04200 [Chloroflexi bacterium]|nr:MAG: hypothetical protein DRI46_09715 [Chloroflexota bacterium]HDD55422.1 hypothetical protein [Chloroflexota bacterium]
MNKTLNNLLGVALIVVIGFVLIESGYFLGRREGHSTFDRTRLNFMPGYTISGGGPCAFSEHPSSHHWGNHKMMGEYYFQTAPLDAP